MNLHTESEAVPSQQGIMIQGHNSANSISASERDLQVSRGDAEEAEDERNREIMPLASRVWSGSDVDVWGSWVGHLGAVLKGGQGQDFSP